MRAITTPEKATNLLKKELKLERDIDLANYLGISRQRLGQFKHGTGHDINNRMLTAFIRLLNAEKKKARRAAQANHT